MKRCAIIAFIALLASCDGRRNGPACVRIDSFPIELEANGKAVELDAVGIYDLKIVDSMLMAVSPQSSNGFWKCYSLPDLQFIGNFLKKGNGPDEYSDAPWLYESQFITDEAGNTKCFVYDFNKGRIRVLDVDMMKKNELVVETEYKLPRTLFGWQYLGNDKFIIKEVAPDLLREERLIFSGSEKTKISPSSVDDLILERGKDINNIATEISANNDGTIIVEACVRMNNLYLYSLDGSFAKTICIGQDNADTPSDVPSIRKKIKKYFTALECYKNCFSVLYLNDFSYQPEEKIKNDQLMFFDWEGNPLARIQLDRHVTSISMNPKTKIAYALNSTTEEIVQYDFSDLDIQL